ncbi:MAG: WG repeat-containing protein [Planctomycetota bacterium]|nr:WG repeat-containing protein [Planctomycetota bacterium]
MASYMPSKRSVYILLIIALTCLTAILSWHTVESGHQKSSDDGKVDRLDDSIIQDIEEKPAAIREGQPAIKNPGPLFPIDSSNNKMGYIDRRGRVVIKPLFDEAGQFSEGLAPVNVGGKRARPGSAKGGLWGYIDTSGKFSCKPRFDAAWPFLDGLAPVRVKNKWGSINHRFEFVARPEYFHPPRFFEGYALVRKDKEWMYIDKSGKVILRAADVTVGPTTPGTRLLGPFPVGEEFGFVDLDGNMFIQPRFSYARHFREGLALVCLGDLTGFIDKTGEIAIEPQFSQPYVLIGFSDGLFPVSIRNKWGYIDKTGKIVIGVKFDLARRFSEGLGRVLIGGVRDGKWGFIDKTGAYSIPPRFHWASGFKNGLANVKIGEYQNYSDAYIDTKGNFVWQEKPDQ